MIKRLYLMIWVDKSNSEGPLAGFKSKFFVKLDHSKVQVDDP